MEHPTLRLLVPCSALRGTQQPRKWLQHSTSLGKPTQRPREAVTRQRPRPMQHHCPRSGLRGDTIAGASTWVPWPGPGPQVHWPRAIRLHSRMLGSVYNRGRIRGAVPQETLRTQPCVCQDASQCCCRSPSCLGAGASRRPPQKQMAYQEDSVTERWSRGHGQGKGLMNGRLAGAESGRY